MHDNRSDKFIFVPFCSLAQAFHAKGLVKYERGSTIKPVINIIQENNINIIQMPCPESLFPNLKNGLNREPQSYNKYEGTQGFRKHCNSIANQTFQQIKSLIESGYKIIGILGIQFSPCCAINLQYTNKGNIDLAGIYIQELQELLNKEKISIQFLGINRRGINTTLKRLNKLLNNK